MVWVYGTVRIFNGEWTEDESNMIHYITMKSKINCNDIWEAMDKARDLWDKMFSQFDDVEIDDIWATK